jgi:hypothetical protein
MAVVLPVPARCTFISQQRGFWLAVDLYDLERVALQGSGALGILRTFELNTNSEWLRPLGDQDLRDMKHAECGVNSPRK